MNKTKKKEKKEKKEFQKTYNNVSECLLPRTNKTLSPDVTKTLVHSIAKSVKVNKNLLDKDKKVNDEWYAKFYHQELFSKFKKLIDEHNEKIKFDVDDMTNKIGKLQAIIVEKERVLEKLKKENKKFKKKK